jgi:hypothetical protein
MSSTKTVVATSAAVVVGAGYLLYRSIPVLLTAVTSARSSRKKAPFLRRNRGPGHPRGEVRPGGGWNPRGRLRDGPGHVGSFCGHRGGTQRGERFLGRVENRQRAAREVVVVVPQNQFCAGRHWNCGVDQRTAGEAPKGRCPLRLPDRDGGHLSAAQEPKSLTPERRWGGKFLWRRVGRSVPLVPQGPHVHEPPKNHR